MKEKLIFAAEVLIVFAVTKFIQQNVMQLPIVGAYLPGAKATSTTATTSS